MAAAAAAIREVEGTRAAVVGVVLACVVLCCGCGDGGIREGIRRRHTAHASQPGGSACRGEAVVPAGDPRSLRRAENALRCLVNRTRVLHGRPRLAADRCLARAGRRHARDMVRNAFFAHVARSGSGPGARASAAGYAPGGERWVVGENLGWGRAPTGTPSWIVGSWMRSPSHRRNILRRSFRDIGTAAVAGAPPRAIRSSSARPAATYAVLMGVVQARRRCA